MRLLVTDEFLWDIFNIVSEAGNILHCMARPHTIRNILPNFEDPVFKKYRNQKNKIKFDQIVYYLKRKNYIKVKNLENKQAIIITKEGLSKALRANFLREGRNKRADGKWVMLIFDIPQKYKKSRNLMTSVLYNLGYKLLQQSVWVTPYDVTEKTEGLLQLYSLDKFVKIFLIEKL